MTLSHGSLDGPPQYSHQRYPTIFPFGTPKYTPMKPPKITLFQHAFSGSWDVPVEVVLFAAALRLAPHRRRHVLWEHRAKVRRSDHTRKVRNKVREEKGHSNNTTNTKSNKRQTDKQKKKKDAARERPLG